MWHNNWRGEVWQKLDQNWDIVIVGGGITGAGLLREAVMMGAKTLLVEQKDFAWGTSSRSSKLVHGGLRYLKEGKVGLTLESVQERKKLLAQGPGLVEKLGFLLPVYKKDKPGRFIYGAGLTFYDLLGQQLRKHYMDKESFKLAAPHLPGDGLKGGFQYADAQTDDARLVLRVIREAVADGGFALNYVKAEELLWEGEQVAGVRLRDMAGNKTAEVRARLVINATGAWADFLRGKTGNPAKLRPLRGSHLVFPNWRFPVAQAISFLHPKDRRPVFVFPWEGITLLGTTDLDHKQELDDEPGISPQEVAYLMEVVDRFFPELHLTLDDVVATFAGVRPVVSSGKADPSKESRDHVVWEEKGLLTVTGGKMTTFRSTAIGALKAVHHRMPDLPLPEGKRPVLNPVKTGLPGINDPALARRLIGRYGTEAVEMVKAAQEAELELIPDTPYLWAELRWAAREEGVVHLEDLLLRRVRLGLLLKDGGASLMPRLRTVCQLELGWDEGRWKEEEEAYLDLWRRCYSLPPRSRIPDWRKKKA